MWESRVLAFAGFPSAEESVGNSLASFEFSTLSSARHFHSASALSFPRIRTRAPAGLRPRARAGATSAALAAVPTETYSRGAGVVEGTGAPV
jgi:hypothetical protein